MFYGKLSFLLRLSAIAYISCGLFAGQISVNDFENALKQLYEGSDVVFMDQNYSDSEKKLLSELKISLPKDLPYGLDFNFQSTLKFDEEQKRNPLSKYNKLRNKMREFFEQTTNAGQVIENGNEMLADMVLNYSKNAMKAFGTEWVFISLKAFHPNNIFQSFPRWHYDGKSDEDFPGADVNFAAVFKGRPTIFARVKSSDQINRLQDKILRLTNRLQSPVNIDTLTAKLTKFMEEETDGSSKANLQSELDRLNLWKEAHIAPTDPRLQRLKNRFLLHKFMKKHINYELLQPRPFEAAMFTMTGKSPAFHAEPDIDTSRLFFSVRLYNTMKTAPYTESGEAEITGIKDPAEY